MNPRLLASSLGLLLSSQSLTGCFFLWDRNPEEPRLLLPAPQDSEPSFRFTESRGCGPFSGTTCAPVRPLLAGVREQVQMSLPYSDASGDPTVTSSDPSIVDVGPVHRSSSPGEAFTGTFDVRAGARAGSATVTVTQGDGQSSTVTLRVADAAGMDLVEDEGTQRYDRARGRITLRVGERISMNGYPVNVDSERLFANDGVIWSVPDDRHVNLSWSFMSGPRVADDHVYIEGRARGTDVLTVRAGVVERTLIVDVQ